MKATLVLAELTAAVLGGLAADSAFRALPREIRRRRRLGEVLDYAVSAAGQRELPEGLFADTGDEALLRFILSPVAADMATIMFSGAWQPVRSALLPTYMDSLSDLPVHLTETQREAVVHGLEAAVQESISFYSRMYHLEPTGGSMEANALLRGINAQLERLRSPDLGQQPVLSLSRLAERIRASSASENSMIYPPDSESYEGIDMDALYVVPSVAASDGSVEVNSILDDPRNFVLTGDPGSGKSTFLKYLNSRGSTRSFGEGGAENPLFLRIELRHYGDQLGTGDLTIAEALAQELSRTLQIRASGRQIETLLYQVPAVILLDGLDELTDVSCRRKVASAIDALVRAYSRVRAFATCRSIGYDLAPLGPDFVRLSLRPFSASQVHAYARRWYHLNPIRAVDPEQSAQSFLEETDSIEDIRSNPLVLSLLCVLYRGRGHIPENRAGVYDRCANLLFRDWDSDRRIVDTHTFDRMVRESVEDLALLFLGKPQYLASGAPAAAVSGRFSAYLAQWQRLSASAADDAARSLVSFCQGRLWVLTKRGTSPSGEPLLGFVHRTFFEYFAARAIAGSATSTSTLTSQSLDLCAAGFPVVAELAIQQRAGAGQGEADQILAQIVLEGVSGNSALASALAVSVLQGCSPRIDTLQLVARFVLWSSMSAVAPWHSGRGEISSTITRRQMVSDALRVAGVRPSTSPTADVIRRPVRIAASVLRRRQKHGEAQISQSSSGVTTLLRLAHAERSCLPPLSDAVVAAASADSGAARLIANSLGIQRSLSGRETEFWSAVVDRCPGVALAGSTLPDLVRSLQLGQVSLGQLIEAKGVDALFEPTDESRVSLCESLCLADQDEWPWKISVWLDAGFRLADSWVGADSLRRIEIQSIARSAGRLDGQDWKVPDWQLPELWLERSTLREMAKRAGQSALNRNTLSEALDLGEAGLPTLAGVNSVEVRLLVGLLLFRINATDRFADYAHFGLLGLLEPLEASIKLETDVSFDAWRRSAESLGLDAEAARQVLGCARAMRLAPAPALRSLVAT